RSKRDWSSDVCSSDLFFCHEYNLLYNVETLYKPLSYCSLATFSIAFHASVAHFMRAGKLDTPCKASISSTPKPSTSISSPTIICENNSDISSAWEMLCPLIAYVIMEAEARLIEQPSPLIQTSSTTSPFNCNSMKILLPHVVLFISTVNVSSSNEPRFLGFL